MTRLRKISVILISLVLAGCSFDVGEPATLGIRFHSPNTTRAAAPSSVSAMSCYMINVAASDLSGNLSKTFGNVSAGCLGLSLVSSLVSFAQLQSGVSLTTNSGTGRTVSVLGIETSDGSTCPTSNDFSEMLASPLPRVYTLGESTGVNLSSSGTSLTIQSSYAGSSATDLMSQCGTFATLSSVSPSSGTTAGGTTLTVTGENFAGSPTVTLGSSACNSVSVSSSTTLTCVTSSASAGTVDLSVTTEEGFRTSLSDAFAYIGSYTQQAYIKAVNNDADDGFGGVAISGDTLVVVASGEDSNQTTITNGTTASSDDSASAAGAVYVYVRSNGIWTQQAYIKTPNAEADDAFGVGVDIDGDTIVVGAWGESSNQTTITNGTTASADNSESSAGAAYIFKRTGTSWAQEAYIKAPNAESFDLFGNSVAISGDTVAVAALNEASNQTTITNGTTASSDNSNGTSGAVYVFTRSGSTWSQQAYIKAPNNDIGDQFGYDIALDGDTLAVGAVFEDSNETSITNGTTASSNDSVSNSGAVYVFKRTGTNWAQEAYIKPSNANASDSFGSGIDIDGNTLVVGAVSESSNQTSITNGAAASSDNSKSESGAVYVFTRSGTTWSEQSYIKASNADVDDIFGETVAIEGDTMVVGTSTEQSTETTILSGSSASSNNDGSDVGAAYIFTRTGTSWSQTGYIKAPNAGDGDTFGSGAVISGTTIVVPAAGEASNQTTITHGTTASSDNSNNASGAVYVFTSG